MSTDPKRKARKHGHKSAWRPDRISRGLLGMAALTERVARPVLGKRGFAAGQVVGRWPEIVGAELALSTTPERVQFERGARTGGTLHLRVASGGATVLIQPQIPLILERVNGFLGAGAIAHIKVVQGPLSQRYKTKPLIRSKPLSEEALTESEAAIGPIEPPALRQALARLGARLKQRNEV